jgi:hypothetical protein
MLVKNLPDVLKVVQGGIEEYFGLHVVQYLSRALGTPLEKQLGINLTSATFVMHSPTGKAVMGIQVNWTFKTEEQGGRKWSWPGDGRDQCMLIPETELHDLEVRVQLGHGQEQDDFLCFLRPYVKQTYPKVNVLLRG